MIQAQLHKLDHQLAILSQHFDTIQRTSNLLSATLHPTFSNLYNHAMPNTFSAPEQACKSSRTLSVSTSCKLSLRSFIVFYFSSSRFLLEVLSLGNIDASIKDESFRDLQGQILNLSSKLSALELRSGLFPSDQPQPFRDEFVGQESSSRDLSHESGTRSLDSSPFVKSRSDSGKWSPLDLDATVFQSPRMHHHQNSLDQGECLYASANKQLTQSTILFV